MTSMLAAVLHKPEDMRLEQVPLPSIGDHDVLIAVKRVGICGTDPHIYRGAFPVPYPLVQGHEFSGEVVAAGSAVTAVKIGDRVTADINMSCGHCFYCRMGQKLFCEKIKQIGVHTDGAFAQFMKAPESNIYKLPDGMTWEEAAYIEPLACAIRGQERAGITMGSTVAIIGGGPMGLVHSLLAKMNGAARVIVSETNAVRIAKAKAFGADHVLHAAEQDPVQTVRDLTEGRGADFVIEAVGAVPTYQQAFQMVRRGGTLIAYGAAPATATMEIKPFEIYSKELTIVGSYAGTYDTWVKAIALIASKRIDPMAIITKTVPLTQIVEGLQEAMTNKDTIKIIVDATQI